MNPFKPTDIYHFSDEISAISRDFAHVMQNKYAAESERIPFYKWMPIFLEYVSEYLGENLDFYKDYKEQEETGIVVSSPEFQKILENAPPWNGPLPSGWREKQNDK